MIASTKYNVVVIGCGNLAWHLVKQFYSLSQPVTVYNHQNNPALKALKKQFKSETVSDLKSIRKDADFYFICVADQAIAQVAQLIKPSKKEALILHCSGSMPLSELGSKHQSTAVFYPVQTFSKKDMVEWKEVPIVLEASNAKTLTRLKDLAKSFSNHLHVADSKTRLTIHLAAVLVNNFSNSLYVAASQLLKHNKQTSHFQLLLPLIRQSLKKIEHLDPLEAQTGPAKRGDKKVLKKHLKLLKNEPEIKKAYQVMSRLIVSQQQ